MEIPITFSIGAAITEPGQRAMNNAMAVADVALYRAKDTGRNRTVHCLRPSLQIVDSQIAPRPTCAACDPVRSAECNVSEFAAIPEADPAN